jgi:hypothetical protein
MSETKRRASALVLAVMIFGLALWHALLPDAALSRAERRRLQQLPALSWESVRSGAYGDELERYLLDQFPLREQFLELRAFLQLRLLHQSDLDGVYLADGGAAEIIPAWDWDQVDYFAAKMRAAAALFDRPRVFCAVVPDKGFYMAQAHGLPAADYAALQVRLRAGLPDAAFVDLFPLLTLADYYRTDPHWRQEALEPVAAAVLTAMGTAPGDFERVPHTLSPFYGAYCGRALGLRPETLTYLTSPVTGQAQVSSAEQSGSLSVYPQDRFGGMDGYDVFLYGAQALVTLENPLSHSGRELVVFRDSFGSSLAPLLLEGYDRVTLVDLRYLDLDYLPQLLACGSQDVLFLYSAGLINTARILR